MTVITNKMDKRIKELEINLKNNQVSYTVVFDTITKPLMISISLDNPLSLPELKKITQLTEETLDTHEYLFKEVLENIPTTKRAEKMFSVYLGKGKWKTSISVKELNVTVVLYHNGEDKDNVIVNFLYKIEKEKENG